MISAGTIRSGKTRLLETTACLGRRVLRASNLSSAVMFRACERFRPPVMLDEVDQARLHEDGNALVQLINDGFEPGGAAWRVGGEKNERLDASGCSRRSLYAASAGFRPPPRTAVFASSWCASRGPEDGAPEQGQQEASASLAPEILRWTQDTEKVLVQNLEPDFPPGIENDRDEDLWRPLLAIADTIGGEVPALARGHARADRCRPRAQRRRGADVGDLRHPDGEQIDRPDVTKIALQRLVGLVNAVDGPWTEYRGDMGCDSRWLSKQLKSFGLRWRNGARPRAQ